MPKEANAFTLRINLGNDAMRSLDDVARALRAVATKLESRTKDLVYADATGVVLDDNGNRVGHWKRSRRLRF